MLPYAILCHAMSLGHALYWQTVEQIGFITDIGNGDMVEYWTCKKHNPKAGVSIFVPNLTSTLATVGTWCPN